MTLLTLTIIAIALVAAAVAFLVAELFLPSHGVLGIGGGLCALGAVAMLMQISVTLGLISAIILLVTAPLAIYVLLKTYPKTPAGKKVFLEQPQVSSESTHKEFLGASGKTLTALHPAGIVEIDGRRIDCISEGDVIDAGKIILVVSVSNGRVVVRETPPV